MGDITLTGEVSEADFDKKRSGVAAEISNIVGPLMKAAKTQGWTKSRLRNVHHARISRVFRRHEWTMDEWRVNAYMKAVYGVADDGLGMGLVSDAVAEASASPVEDYDLVTYKENASQPKTTHIITGGVCPQYIGAEMMITSGDTGNH